MLGAVDSARDDPTGQATPITAHWLDSAGAVGWLCIRGAPLRGVVADASIALRADGEVVLEYSASGAVAFGERSWSLGERRIEATGVDVSPPRAHGDRIRCALRLPSGEGRLRFG